MHGSLIVKRNLDPDAFTAFTVTLLSGNCIIRSDTAWNSYNKTNAVVGLIVWIV